jgi:thymidylate synthase
MPDTFPSERVGFVFHGKTVLEAWKSAIQAVMRYGTVKGTQYGMPQKELVGVHWVVQGEDPSAPQLPTEWPQELLDLTGASASALAEYYPVMLAPDAQPGTSYTYGNRLQRYPHGDAWLDQIEDGIIKQFRASPDSRRGVATTLVPAVDMESKEPPCLTQVQCLQQGGAIHLLATFRSHDMFKAAIPNAFALRKLQERIATSTGFAVGALQITSQSAHVYEADWMHANRLVACTFTEREPSLVFHADHADPRGNLIIRVVADGISLSLMGSDGAELWNYTGPSARACQAKLAHLQLIHSIGHAIDIGMELQKADLARQHNLPYTQDRSLTIQTIA